QAVGVTARYDPWDRAEARAERGAASPLVARFRAAAAPCAPRDRESLIRRFDNALGKTSDVVPLKVWQKAHRFVIDVYQQSRRFPADERFGLTAHLRKSATSVPSNIAEGCGREGERELARFLSIAAGSASESEYQLLLAREAKGQRRIAN